MTRPTLSPFGTRPARRQADRAFRRAGHAFRQAGHTYRQAGHTFRRAGHTYRQAGFTMIEIMVVLAIVGVLTAAIVGNYGSFRSATVATNMAFELAASVRQSQQYGLGVRLNGQPGTTDDDGNPNDTYGVEFTKGSAVYSIFRELDTPDGKCDAVGGCDCSAGATNECVEQIRMLQQVTVEGLCTGNAGMFPEDLLVDGDCGHESLSVLYTRPNPEAAIYTVSGLDVDASLAGVVIRGGDHCRLVRIYSNGQVAVGSISAADAGPIFASACGA